MNTFVFKKSCKQKYSFFLDKNCCKKATVASSNWLRKSSAYVKIVEGVLAQKLRGNFCDSECSLHEMLVSAYLHFAIIGVYPYNHYLIIIYNTVIMPTYILPYY
jgi:hypothetical protein